MKIRSFENPGLYRPNLCAFYYHLWSAECDNFGFKVFSRCRGFSLLVIGFFAFGAALLFPDNDLKGGVTGSHCSAATEPPGLDKVYSVRRYRLRIL